MSSRSSIPAGRSLTTHCDLLQPSDHPPRTSQLIASRLLAFTSNDDCNGLAEVTGSRQWDHAGGCITMDSMTLRISKRFSLCSRPVLWGEAGRVLFNCWTLTELRPPMHTAIVDAWETDGQDSFRSEPIFYCIRWNAIPIWFDQYTEVRN